MKKGLALLVTLMMLAGCGAEAPTMNANAGKKSRDLIVTPQQPTQQQPTFNTQALLADISQRYQNMQSLQSQVIVYDAYNGKNTSSKSLSYFQKPNRFSVQVTEHTDSKAVGTKIAYTGGTEAKIKTKFFGFQVKLNLGLSDSRICNLRGDTLNDTGIVRMMSILLDPQAQVKFMSQGTLAGAPIAILEVVSQRSLRGITREVYCVNLQTRLPVIREMYEGTRLTYRMQFTNTLLDPQLPANAFTND